MSDLADPPNVSAVIVTWNKKQDVLKLLSQLDQIHYPQEKLQIIVVDNHSNDGTADDVEAMFPQVHLIKNRSNLGGSGGFNTGMRHILANHPDCQYIWLLDNDVEVSPDCLSALVNVMTEHQDAAICGSRVMNSDKPDQLVEIGAFIDYKYGGILRNIPTKQALKDPCVVFDVDYVAACSLLARVDCLKKCGLLHEKLFIYWDDMEWGARFKSFGYKVLAANSSVVYHPFWEGRSVYSADIWRFYYRVRNSLWFFSTYGKGLYRKILLCRMVIRFLLKALILSLSTHSRLAASYIDGVFDFFGHKFGKKGFTLPPTNLVAYITQQKIKRVALFVEDRQSALKAQHFIDALNHKIPKLSVLLVVPQDLPQDIIDRLYPDKYITYRRITDICSNIPAIDKFKIYQFLKKNSAQLLLSGANVPKMAVFATWHTAIVDFDENITIAIEKINFKNIIRIPVIGTSGLTKILIRL